VAITIAVQEHKDRVLSEEISETASQLQDTVEKITSIRDAESKDMNDYIRAYSEIAPLLDDYDRQLQKITDLYSQARERDKSLFNITRLYRRSNITNWENMSEILGVSRALSQTMRQETSIIHNMAGLPQSERIPFWHEHYLPLEAEKKGLRAKLLILGQRMSPAEQ